MNKIIITVTSLSKSYNYDLEVPTSILIGKLKDNIAETLNGYDSKLLFNPSTIGLFVNRLGRRLADDETLENAGVWNGDYITLIGMENG